MYLIGSRGGKGGGGGGGRGKEISNVLVKVSTHWETRPPKGNQVARTCPKLNSYTKGKA